MTTLTPERTAAEPNVGFHHPRYKDRPPRGDEVCDEILPYGAPPEARYRCGKGPKERIHQWVMPDWMEPYRDLFVNTGGNSVEDLLSDYATNGRNNQILSALIISVDSQVILLHRLRKHGLLKEEA